MNDITQEILAWDGKPIPPLPGWEELARPFEIVQYWDEKNKSHYHKTKDKEVKTVIPVALRPCKIEGCTNKRHVTNQHKVVSMCEPHYREEQARQQRDFRAERKKRKAELSYKMKLKEESSVSHA